MTQKVMTNLKIDEEKTCCSFPIILIQYSLYISLHLDKDCPLIDFPRRPLLVDLLRCRGEEGGGILKGKKGRFLDFRKCVVEGVERSSDVNDSTVPHLLKTQDMWIGI